MFALFVFVALFVFAVLPVPVCGGCGNGVGAVDEVSVWGEGTILTTQFSKSGYTPVSWVALFGVPYLRFLVCSLVCVT